MVKSADEDMVGRDSMTIAGVWIGAAVMGSGQKLFTVFTIGLWGGGSTHLVERFPSSAETGCGGADL